MMRSWIVAFGMAIACSSSPKQSERPGHTVVSTTSIDILDPVSFVGDTAEIAPSSTKILDSTASTLDGNPSIRIVNVVVHGADKALSLQRANAIRDQLISRHIAPERLRAAAGDDGAVRTDFEIVQRDGDSP